MIEVRNLTKKYGDHFAVQDISFSLEKGKIYGLLGPNGAGKSTTMNIMTGYIAATSGEVIIEGHDIFKEAEEAKKHIGYLPEIPPLYMDMTVWEYLFTVADLKGVPKSERKSMIGDVMEKVMITNMKDRLIKNLSKGYKQRVGIAQALIGNPKVIILDEPTVGLDPRQILEIRDLIRNLGKEHTVILSSHILQEVNSVCDKIMIIAHGKLKVCATPEELYHTYCGNRLLYVRTRISPERLNGVLEGIEGEKVFSREDGLTQAEIQFHEEVVYADGTDVRDRIFKIMCEQNIPLVELYFKKPTLEQVFMELTQEES